MYQRRPRKFRSSYGGRNYQSRGKGNGQGRIGTQPFSNDLPRNNFRTIHNPEKLFEKYSNLAKEASSAGEKTLSENYLQHADHFMRLIGEKNKAQNKSADVSPEKKPEEKINLENNNVEKDNVEKDK